MKPLGRPSGKRESVAARRRVELVPSEPPVPRPRRPYAYAWTLEVYAGKPFPQYAQNLASTARARPQLVQTRKLAGATAGAALMLALSTLLGV